MISAIAFINNSSETTVLYSPSTRLQPTHPDLEVVVTKLKFSDVFEASLNPQVK